MSSHPGFIAMSKGFAPSSPTSCSPPVKSFKPTLLDELKTLADPRTQRKPDHLLVDIVAIGILATLAGADNMVAVARPTVKKNTSGYRTF